MTDASSLAGSLPAPAPYVRTRLSLMMFLQYAIWGSWLPILWPYLSTHRGFDAGSIGNAFAVGALGAIIAPWIAGQIADRYFNTERFLGICHILGGALIWMLASIETVGQFLWFSFAYSVVYSPTLPLTNSLALTHCDRDRDFGKIRLWGTVGWIAVGIAVGQWLLRAHTPGSEALAGLDEGASKAAINAAQHAGMADAFKLSGILGMLMGCYCLFALPKTPPQRGQRRSAIGEAIQQVRLAPLVTLFMLAVPVSCIHQFYFVHTSGFVNGLQGANEDAFSRAVNSVFGVGGGGLMTIGQMSEIVVLAFIPALARSMSRKTLLAIGLCAYAARMALFAYGADLAGLVGTNPLAFVIPGIAMHGLCFGCFIFVAFMIVDEESSGDVRASAQSLFNLVIIGVGIIVGSKIAGAVAQITVVDGVQDYKSMFSVPMWGALFCLAMLLMFYLPQGGRKPGGEHR
jgi:nucleoside transporter